MSNSYKYNPNWIEDDEEFEADWKSRFYPARLPEAKGLKKEDIMFTLMLFMGMSKTDAYLTAYNTTASRSSVAAMATRKSQEHWCERYREALHMAAIDGTMKFY